MLTLANTIAPIVFAAGAQLPSYAVLFPLYAYLSTNTLTSWKLVDPPRLVMNYAEESNVLFLSENELVAIPLAGGRRQAILRLRPRQQGSYLELATAEDR